MNKFRIPLLVLSTLLITLNCNVCSSGTDKINGPEDVYGCTDTQAENYNPQATVDDGSCTYDNTGLHFQVDLPSTGVNQLIVVRNTVTGLETGDEIGFYDAAGITNSQDCSSQLGSLLVGTAVWDGNQLSVSAIGSIDNCALGGIQLPGWVDNNPIVIRVWDASEQMEYAVEAVYEVGSGFWGDLFTVVSGMNIVRP